MNYEWAHCKDRSLAVYQALKTAICLRFNVSFVQSIFISFTQVNTAYY